MSLVAGQVRCFRSRSPVRAVGDPCGLRRFRSIAAVQLAANDGGITSLTRLKPARIGTTGFQASEA